MNANKLITGNPAPIRVYSRPFAVLVKLARLRGVLLRLGAIATILLCAMAGCGGPKDDIVGKWRAAGDDTAMVWEFSKDGSVQMGSIRGRYRFGGQDRIKIETSSAISVYQIELSGDHMTLKDSGGSKLEFTKVK